MRVHALGAGAQSVPMAQSLPTALAQEPLPAAGNAFAPEQYSAPTPSEQTPSYESPQELSHIIVVPSLIAFAMSSRLKGIESKDPL